MGASSHSLPEKEQTYLGAVRFLSWRSFLRIVSLTRSVSRFGREFCDLSVNEVTQNAKLLTDIYNEVIELRESLNKRLDFPPTEILERYLRNDLGIALELSGNINGHTARFSAIVTNIPINHVRCDGNSTCRNADGDVSMFVVDVQLVKNDQRMVDRVRGIIGLKILDENQGSRIGDSLYMSLVTGSSRFLSWPHFRNGKFDLCWLGDSVPLVRELPDNVVETGSKVVQDFPGEHVKTNRNDALSMVRNCLERSLSIVISPSGVIVFLEESRDFLLKIEDVLLGPF